MEADRARQLMMAKLDGEISELEERELAGALEATPALRVEMERMVALARRLARYRLKDPADEVLAELDRTLLRRAGLPLGWLLLLAGLFVLAGAALLGWFGDAEIHPVLRVAGGAVVGGALLLLLVKIRERWIEHREDPYQDVIR